MEIGDLKRGWLERNSRGGAGEHARRFLPYLNRREGKIEKQQHEEEEGEDGIQCRLRENRAKPDLRGSLIKGGCSRESQKKAGSAKKENEKKESFF